MERGRCCKSGIKETREKMNDSDPFVVVVCESIERSEVVESTCVGDTNVAAGGQYVVK